MPQVERGLHRVIFLERNRHRTQMRTEVENVQGKNAMRTQKHIGHQPCEEPDAGKPHVHAIISQMPLHSLKIIPEDRRRAVARQGRQRRQGQIMPLSKFDFCPDEPLGSPHSRDKFLAQEYWCVSNGTPLS